MFLLTGNHFLLVHLLSYYPSLSVFLQQSVILRHNGNFPFFKPLEDMTDILSVHNLMNLESICIHLWNRLYCEGHKPSQSSPKIPPTPLITIIGGEMGCVRTCNILFHQHLQRYVTATNPKFQPLNVQTLQTKPTDTF